MSTTVEIHCSKCGKLLLNSIFYCDNKPYCCNCVPQDAGYCYSPVPTYKDMDVKYAIITDNEKDTKRLDWLSKHAFAFLFDHEKIKGSILMSGNYLDDDPFDLRKAIDEAMERRGNV